MSASTYVSPSSLFMVYVKLMPIPLHRRKQKNKRRTCKLLVSIRTSSRRLGESVGPRLRFNSSIIAGICQSASIWDIKGIVHTNMQTHEYEPGGIIVTSPMLMCSMIRNRSREQHECRISRP